MESKHITALTAQMVLEGVVELVHGIPKLCVRVVVAARVVAQVELGHARAANHPAAARRAELVVAVALHVAELDLVADLRHALIRGRIAQARGWPARHGCVLAVFTLARTCALDAIDHTRCTEGAVGCQMHGAHVLHALIVSLHVRSSRRSPEVRVSDAANKHARARLVLRAEQLRQALR
eukprot:SAG22_NODE_6451_length_853_cov_1.157825_1_plen_180_part_00